MRVVMILSSNCQQWKWTCVFSQIVNHSNNILKSMLTYIVHSHSSINPVPTIPVHPGVTQLVNKIHEVTFGRKCLKQSFTFVVGKSTIIAVFGSFPSEEWCTVLQESAIALVDNMSVLEESKTSFIETLGQESIFMIPLEQLRYKPSSDWDRYVNAGTPFIEFVESIPFTSASWI